MNTVARFCVVGNDKAPVISACTFPSPAAIKAPSLAEVKPPSLLYDTERRSSAAEVGQMSRVSSRSCHGRCYFCRAEVHSKASYGGVCLYHHLGISFCLFLLLARRRHWSRLWGIVRWSV